MSRQPWMDRIVGERMALDQEFNERVQSSRFSNQQWGLIMTAAEFEIERPEDPERARMVADTSKLPQIMPELDAVEAQMGAGPGGAPAPSDGGGLFGSIKDALGFGGGGDDGPDPERLAAAEDLVEEYAAALQKRLEDRGKWTRICEAAERGAAGAEAGDATERGRDGSQE